MLIVTGIGLTIAGTLLLVVGSIVSSAVGAATSGATSSAPDPGVWIEWIGVPFLALGLVFLGLGLWWALR